MEYRIGGGVPANRSSRNPFYFFLRFRLDRPFLSGLSLRTSIQMVTAMAAQLVMSIITMRTNSTEGVGSAKTMMYLMPLMTLWMGYMLPAALCIYWIANTVFSLIQEVALNKYFNKILDREETEKEKAAREKRYAKYQKQKELMAQQQMNGGGRNDRKPQPKKKKQGGEEKHSGTNENGRVGQRPYARGRAYDEKHYE